MTAWLLTMMLSGAPIAHGKVVLWSEADCRAYGQELINTVKVSLPERSAKMTFTCEDVPSGTPK